MESVVIPVDEYVTWEVAASLPWKRHPTAGVSARGRTFRDRRLLVWHSPRNTGAESHPAPISRHSSWSPEYIRTEVDLAQGNRFSTDLIRFEANMRFDHPLSFLTSNIQYDNLSELLGMNNRLRWIIRPGSDLYPWCTITAGSATDGTADAGDSSRTHPACGSHKGEHTRTVFSAL
ncbi:MAG: hypothetical protein U5K69_28495 [Balneolaceae bacterium]|nr:hypothetical protein [Balneolaceae bacterium]